MRSSLFKFIAFALIGSIFANTLSHAQPAKELVSPRKQIIFFDLPGQALQNGLIEFAIQSKYTVIVDNKIVKDLHSAPLVGPHDPDKALSILLSKTGLGYKILDQSKSIVIESKKLIDSEQQSNAGNRKEKNETKIEELVVSGPRYPFRYSTISNSQVYGNISIYNSARFITTIPQSLITDTSPDELGDVLKFSSGFSPGDGVADSNDGFYIRGFPRYGVYIDGFRMSQNTGIKYAPESIDRVEILKGPSTLFYGQSEPGGIVNIVRKKPMADFQNKISHSRGSGDLQFLMLDSTGPLPSTKDSLRYRLIASDRKHANFRDIQDIERQYLSSSIDWTINQNTTVDLSYEFQSNRQQKNQGTLVILPVNNTVNIIGLDQEPRLARPYFKAEQHLYSLGLNHYFLQNWSLRSQLNIKSENREGVRTTKSRLLSNDILLSENELDPDVNYVFVGGILIPFNIGTNIDSGEEQNFSVAKIRSIYDERSQESAIYFKTVADGNYKFLSKDNDISLGFDWHQQDDIDSFTLAERTDLDSITISSNNENRQLIESVFDSNAPLGDLSFREQNLILDDYGLFLLNNMELSRLWQISIGGRYSVTKAKQKEHNANTFIDLEDFSKFSSELGLRYEPVDDLALYANYSEGFRANYQIDDLGTQITEPETSTQTELGAKTILFNGRLVSTAALFKIEKENVISIQFDEDIRRVNLGGKRRTFGFDFDITYQLSNNTNIIGSLSLIDPEIRKGQNAGKRPAMASTQMGGLFINHEFHRGFIDGLNLNLGGYFIGDRFINDENSDYIEGYSTIDFGIAYSFNSKYGNYLLQLNTKNALDKEYVLASEEQIRQNVGEGRSTVIKLSIEL